MPSHDVVLTMTSFAGGVPSVPAVGSKCLFIVDGTWVAGDRITTAILVGSTTYTPMGSVVMGATPQRPKKPDPSAALEIAARFDVPPEDFLFIGDTSIDMQTACAAGMFAVGVLWGFRPAAELIAAGGKMFFKHPTDLLAWLRSVEMQ